MNNERLKCPKFEYGFYSDSLKECFEKFGAIFNLPIVEDPYREMESHYQSGNILDIGSGKEKVFLTLISSKLTTGKYYSLDTDPQGNFDFNTIDDIPDDLKFSLIIANQVLEHLDIQESIGLMYKASSHLESEGKLIATVPNIAHPIRQISNITHRTAWGYNSLYMLFKYADLNVVKIARYSKRHPEGYNEVLLTEQLSKLYGIDWCDSILTLGKKE
jgi:hypothetical protein